MHLLQLAIAAAVTNLLFAMPLFAESKKDGYLFTQGYYVEQDDDRAIFDGDGQGFRMGIGSNIKDHWYWETNLAYDVLETGITGFTDYYQLHLGLDAVYRFRKEDQARPFLFLGIGAVRDDVFPSFAGKPDKDATSFYSNVGLGIVTPELFDVGLKLRVDARGVFSEFHDGYLDWHLSIGFEVPFGGREVVTNTVYKEIVREVAIAPVDSDGDGVFDTQDRCANTLKGARADATGCVIEKQNFDLRGVKFRSGSEQLSADSVEALIDVAAFMEAQPALQVQIAGHTDAVGSAVLNKQLSQKRASSVKSFLIQSGISANRMRSVGYGESQPIADNATADGRAANRRVEFRIN
ncbi:MAG: OOP family OmpA-OmpF porin [Litorivivens sp.]|jgi:OOP family OmpA-OmpF porin